MQTTPSSELFNNLKAALEQPQQQLTSSYVLKVAKQTIEQYFTSHQPKEAATTKGRKSTAKASKSDTTSSVAPTQWPRLLTTKQFGLVTYFAAEAEAIKKSHPKLGHFLLIKMLRDQMESTDKWGMYVDWVRSIHPIGHELKNPSPRKSDTENQKSKTAVLPMTQTLVAGAGAGSSSAHQIDEVQLDEEQVDEEQD